MLTAATYSLKMERNEKKSSCFSFFSIYLSKYLPFSVSVYLVFIPSTFEKYRAVLYVIESIFSRFDYISVLVVLVVFSVRCILATCAVSHLPFVDSLQTFNTNIFTNNRINKIYDFYHLKFSFFCSFSPFIVWRPKSWKPRNLRRFVRILFSIPCNILRSCYLHLICDQFSQTKYNRFKDCARKRGTNTFYIINRVSSIL